MAFPRTAARADGTETEGTRLRKQLFMIERQLERRSAGRTQSLMETVLTRNEFRLPETIEPAPDESAAENGSKESGEKKEPGSVSVGLNGGTLTGYNHSSTGLDLSEATGAGLKLMLRPESIDLDELEKDGSMRDAFSSANREDFYGLGNFERFADLFEEEEKTKDYSITGVGMNLDIGGGLSLGLLNYSRPPKRKKIVFFGSGSDGPYKIRATNIIPGSEIVKVNGGEISRGTGYTIHYTSGEITFASPVGDGDRVIVEYELAEGGGSDPGRFTGFRLETVGEEKGKDEDPERNPFLRKSVYSEPSSPKTSYSDVESYETGATLNTREPDSDEDSEKRNTGLFRLGPLALEKWGISHFTNEVINYSNTGGDISRREIDHKLMGFDGALALWESTKMNFEVAKSDGSKSREIGRYAKTEFTIADTKASDGNPLGPFYLDETKLPIIENSEEVRINDTLLTRDEDYTLDLEYGTLRLKDRELNLSELHRISIEYRYLTEEDRLSREDESVSGMAGLVSMDNTWGGLRHHYSIDRRGADFMLVGGRSGNRLESEEQEISWDSGGGLSLSWGRNHGVALLDRFTGLERIDRGRRYSAAYKTGSYQVSFKSDTKERFDNLPVRETDTTKENRSLGIQYDISEKYRLSFDQKWAEGSDLRGGNISSTDSVEKNAGLEAQPLKNLKLNLKLAAGNDTNESAGKIRESEKKSRSVSVDYKPWKNLQLGFDMSSTENKNSETATDPETVAPATGTQPTGNDEIKWNIRYKPFEGTTMTLRRQNSETRQVNGSSDRARNSVDIRHEFSEKTNVQYQVMTMDSTRPGQNQNTDTETVTLKTQAPWFDGMEISLKHNTQKTRVERLVENVMRSSSDSVTDGIAVKCSPFWEGRAVTFEYRKKRGSQDTTGQDPSVDAERTFAAGIEIPVTGESYMSVSREMSRTGGRRSTRRALTEVTLNGSPWEGATLQLSYRSEAFTDSVNPQTNRRDASLNIVAKREFRW